MSGRSSTEIPAHLRSTVDLLVHAFEGDVSEQDYLPLLALLGEHMSEESLGLAVELRFGRDRYEVWNDLAKARSSHAPTAEAMAAVRARLERVGFAEWIAEDEEQEGEIASPPSARTIRLTENEAWRIYLLMEEMTRFLHQGMRYPSVEHVHRWLESGVFGELSDLFYRVVGPWFPVDDDTGFVIGPGGIPHEDEPFEPSGRTAAQKDLRDVLVALSEKALASQWYEDFEYILWDRIGRGASQLGNITRTEASLAELLELSQGAGGWFHFCDDAGRDAMADGLVFVHRHEWEAMYEEWLERVPASARPRDR